MVWPCELSTDLYQFFFFTNARCKAKWDCLDKKWWLPYLRKRDCSFVHSCNCTPWNRCHRTCELSSETASGATELRCTSTCTVFLALIGVNALSHFTGRNSQVFIQVYVDPTDMYIIYIRTSLCLYCSSQLYTCSVWTEWVNWLILQTKAPVAWNWRLAKYINTPAGSVVFFFVVVVVP